MTDQSGCSLYCALRENASHAQVRTLENEFATNVSKETSTSCSTDHRSHGTTG